MSKFPLLLLAVSAAAQTQNPANPFDKAPSNVDDALRARVQEFYQDHVESKFRKAEQLVAEESKDGFYAANKPALLGFRVGDIAYSDNYQKAKVTVIGKMMITFLGLGAPKLMEVPFPSYWKVEGGQWCWYIFNDPNQMTPFGKINPKTTSGPAADPSAAFQMPDTNAIVHAVRADRTSVKLPKKAGAEENVTIANEMPGVVKLQVEAPSYPGLEAKLDKTELAAGGKAVLTLRSADAKDYLGRTVRILVQPTNQPIDIQVTFQ